MSTIAYATITRKREQSRPGFSTNADAPGVNTWVDAMASLVPSEVLAAHAVLLSVTTMTSNADGVPTTTISDVETLRWVFYVLAALSGLLYAGVRAVARSWDRHDFIRVLIPPSAFVAWTMLQRSTAFDAAFPDVTMPQRTAAAVVGAIILSAIAAALAYRADQKTP